MRLYELTLPTTSTPKLRYTVELSGVDYELSYYYATRNKSWYISISNRQGDILLANQRMTPIINILKPYVSDVLPAGGLYLIPADTQKQIPEVSFENLSTDFKLYYITE
jgi:hypothetical protein